jgi:hypothetical protein
MPQKRLVINLSEIIHLEIYCNACGNPSILPLEDQPDTPERRSGAEIYIASYMCASCLKPFTEVKGFHATVNTIREGLRTHRHAQGEFAIHLIVQQ